MSLPLTWISCSVGAAIYLSDTTDLTGNFVELDFRGVRDGLPAGQTHVSNFVNLYIPGDAPLGDVYLVAEADNFGEVVETDESNNLLAEPAQVRAPDLIVEDVTGPSGGRRGETISGQVVLFNQGLVGTPYGVNFEVEIYLSTDSIIGVGDVSLGTVLASQVVGRSYVNFTKLVPGSMNKGNYYLGAIVDSTDVIVESDETNNSGASIDTIRIR